MGLPPTLPLRWVMWKRRLEAAAITVEGDRYGVAELYESAEALNRPWSVLD